MRRAVMVSAVTAALVVGGAPLAAAAPPERETIPLVCDDGETYEVVVSGGGAFTPGRVVGTNQVLVPIAFGETVGTAPDGTVVFTDPPIAKGGGNVQARNPRETVECDFTTSFVLPEPVGDVPAGTLITVTGSVTGFFTGR
jgi:hypothetical protein